MDLPKYLWRDDGFRFTLNANQRYSMDDSGMFTPYEYTFERLMLTGVFGPWPPYEPSEESNTNGEP